VEYLGASTIGTGSVSLGIAAGNNLPSLPAAALDQRLAGIRALGAKWVRFDLNWSDIGWRGAGTYNWTEHDRVVHAVTAHGLLPLAILDYTPAWARLPECAKAPTCRPRSPALFGAFAAAAATRYAPLGVHTWEVWNEPNIEEFYAPKPDATSYTALLKAAYSAVKKVDKSAVVLTGGTSPCDTAADGALVNAVDFLTQIYAAGAKGYFDAAAHHPYTFPYTPNNAWPGNAWSDLASLHAIMVSKGDGQKRVWATEYGAPTGGPGTAVTSGAAGDYAASSYVSEALQASTVTLALSRYRTYSWAGPLFWYTYQDDGTSTTSIENFFGLLRANGSHKPAYDAFRKAAS
jgi:hypothetical protein